LILVLNYYYTQGLLDSFWTGPGSSIFSSIRTAPCKLLETAQESDLFLALKKDGQKKGKWEMGPLC
jgi:hypothetical protein